MWRVGGGITSARSPLVLTKIPQRQPAPNAQSVEAIKTGQGNLDRRLAQERIARRHYVAALRKLRKQGDFAFAVGSRPTASAGGAGRGSPAGQIALRLGDYEYFSLGKGRRLPCPSDVGDFGGELLGGAARTGTTKARNDNEGKELSEIISSLRLGALVREEAQRYRTKRLYNAAKLYLFASAEGSAQASFTLGTMFERGELDAAGELGIARSTLTRRASLARAESFYLLARGQSAAAPRSNEAAVFAADAGIFILSLRQRWWWHAYGLEELVLGTPALRALLPDAPILDPNSDGVDAEGRVCGQEEIPMNVRVLAGAMTMDGEKALGRYIRMWSRGWMWAMRPFRMPLSSLLSPPRRVPLALDSKETSWFRVWDSFFVSCVAGPSRARGGAQRQACVPAVVGCPSSALLCSALFCSALVYSALFCSALFCSAVV